MNNEQCSMHNVQFEIYNFQMSGGFVEHVYAVVRKIPRGEVWTYGEIAKAMGSPRAARAVGQVLKRNFDLRIPCHRVVRADGKLGGYNRGAAKKKSLLCAEGVRSLKK